MASLLLSQCSSPKQCNTMTKQGQKRTHRESTPIRKDVIDCEIHQAVGGAFMMTKADPRKRTLLACELCRHRKTKCDAAKPACGFCADLGVVCVYRDAVTPKLDHGSKTILNRLDKLEDLIKEHLCGTIKREQSTDVSLDGAEPSSLPSQAASLDYSQVSPVSSLLNNTQFDYERRYLISEFSSISAGHTAAASQLLAWPQISELLSSPHQNFQLLRLEFQKSQRREDLLPTQAVECIPNFDRIVTDRLVQCYWEHQQASTPILHYSSFETIYWTAQTQGIRNDIDSCCVLLVYALGAASFTSHNRTPGAPYRVGLEYYKMAISIMGSLCTFASMPDIVTTQCTCLSAAFLGYLGKPLEQHRLNTSAAASVAQLLHRLRLETQCEAQQDLLNRLYWCCHNTESLLLAEIEAPKTNLESLVDLVGMPIIRGLQDFDTICFCASIAIRRLVNRVHNALYAPKRSRSPIHCLLPLASELLFQLNSWLENIPRDVRPDPNVSLYYDDKQLYLKLDYFSCKHLIHRPFLLYVLISDPNTFLNQTILDHTRHCIEACKSYILAMRHAIDRPRDNIWPASQTVLASALVLIASSRHPITARYTPADIEILINISLDFLQIWCGCSPSIEYVYQCLNECRENRGFRQSHSAASSTTVINQASPCLGGPIFYTATQSPQAHASAPAQAQASSHGQSSGSVQIQPPATIGPPAADVNGTVLPGNFLHQLSWPAA